MTQRPGPKPKITDEMMRSVVGMKVSEAMQHLGISHTGMRKAIVRLGYCLKDARIAKRAPDDLARSPMWRDAQKANARMRSAYR